MTDFSVSLTNSFEIKVAVTDLTQTDRWFFGTCDNVSTSCICLGYGGYGITSFQQRNIIHSNEGKDYDIHTLVFGNNYLKIDNIFQGSSTENSIAIYSPLTIFKLNNYNTNPCKCRIYYLKIFEGDTLTHYLVPYMKKSVLGMYDKVTHKFYSGIGTFLYG